MNKQLTLFTLLIVGLVVIGGCSKEKPASDNVVEAGGTKDRACSECEHLENHSCVAYKCCSDSDCSDGNQETEDTCINPSTLTSECEHKAIIKTCEDGTVYGECSGSKPSYCDNGNLLNNCNLCGCPTDRSTCLTNGDCSRFSENVDCENKDYKMAFILLVRSSEDANQDVLNQLSAIKNEFPVYFSEATAHKTQMDVASDTYIMYAKDSMLYANNVIPSEVTKEFYKEHNDVYDFLSIYTTFQSEQSSSHSLVVQNIQGIGSPLWDYSNTYGSKGKLKGVNFLRSVSQNFLIDDTSDLTIAMNILLHETGHQWCCYIGDNFGEGQRLEIKQQGIHFYRGLQSPYETGDSMNADYWVQNEDGTFKRQNTVGVTKYHPFQLYFMGLLPEEEYGTEFDVYKYGPVNFEFEKAVLYKKVSVNNITEIEGKRECIQK